MFLIHPYMCKQDIKLYKNLKSYLKTILKLNKSVHSQAQVVVLELRSLIHSQIFILYQS